MTQTAHLSPSPFLLHGGGAGILLIHGFTGAPPEMRLIGDYLHERGLTVSAPLLPGHGTTVEDMNSRAWTEWAAHAEHTLADLQQRCERVFVAGLSMGSLLTLYLAARHPELSGAIAYSPALMVQNRLLPLTGIARRFLKTLPKPEGHDTIESAAIDRLWSYDENPVAAAHELTKLMADVRRNLARIQCPILIIHSTQDAMIHPRSAQTTFDGIGTTQKELITLENSGHCITVDAEWEFVAARTFDFIEAHRAG